MLKMLTICLAVLLTGCVSNSLTPSPVSQSDLSERTGLFMVSFARDPSGDSYDLQRFIFKSVDSQKVYEIESHPKFNIMRGVTKDDFKTSESNGGIFLQALPARQYIFTDFFLMRNTGTGYASWSPKEDYAIPFEISANKVNYGGEIKLVTVMGENIFGFDVAAGGLWVVSDQLERDMPFFTKKHPEFARAEFTKVIPSREDLEAPLVLLPFEQTNPK